MDFLVIVTGYNCRQYVRDCYNGLISQTYARWRAVFLSDGSTDGTGDELREIAKDDRCFVEVYDENTGAAKRRFDAINKYGNENDIIVLHGMDDYCFPHALAVIAEHYRAGKLMTYGNWIDQDGQMLPKTFPLEFDEQTHANRDYRKVVYRSTGLNTFYKFLYDKIPEDDFKIDGKWIDSTTESEVMFSCLEMCGKDRIGIVYQPICLYRKNLPGGTLKRLGVDYKYKIYDIVKARPKRDLYEEKKRVKIVNISKHDWANFSYDNAKALQAAGFDCEAYVCNDHGFSYQKCATKINLEDFATVCEKADIVHVMHSDMECYFIARKLNKKIFVYHTGSGYRANYVKYNEVFNPGVDISFIALGELMGLGANNEKYVVGAVDTLALLPQHLSCRELVFAHYPSKPEVKGTKEIITMMKALEKKHDFLFFYDDSGAHTPHETQLRKMNDCDIYIELFKPELNGQKYGSWGISALEAAAMGKIVVTQNLSKEIYEKHYGECPFVLVENAEDFSEKVSALLSMSREAIRSLQERTRQWVEGNHSHAATGRYLKKIIDAHL